MKEGNFIKLIVLEGELLAIQTYVVEKCKLMILVVWKWVNILKRNSAYILSTLGTHYIWDCKDMLFFKYVFPY